MILNPIVHTFNTQTVKIKPLVLKIGKMKTSRLADAKYDLKITMEVKDRVPKDQHTD